MFLLRFSKSRIFSALLMVFFLFAQLGLAIPGYALTTGQEVQPSTGNPLYKDVITDDPNFIFINYLSSVGMLQGFPDGSFRPGSGLTRGEAAALMAKTAGLKPMEGKTVFKDVGPKHWAAASITAAKNAGLLTGYPDGTFRPQAALTRAEAITLLLKLSQQPDPGVALPALADITPKHWAARSVAVGLASEMVGLSSDYKHFLPYAKFTRGSLARALAVLLTKDPAFYQPSDHQNQSTGYNPINTTLTNNVTVIKGMPTVIRSGGTVAESVETGMELQPGDTINTGAFGNVDITFPDGTGLRLEENTQLTVKESRGRSYIKPDGSAGTAVEWLAVELKQGKVFGALATNVEASGSTVQAMSLGNLFENRVRAAAIATKPLPWWKQSGVKRTKVKIDMPTGVAAIRGTFWENSVKPDGSFTTSLLIGTAEVTSGGNSVDLTAGQRTEVDKTGDPPAAPKPLTQEDKKEWVKQKDWAVQRAQDIQAKQEQQVLPPPPPAETPQAPAPLVSPVETPQQPGQTTPLVPDISSLVSDALDSVNTETTTGSSDDGSDYTPPQDITVAAAATDATGNKITLSFDKTVSDPVGKQDQFIVLVDGESYGVTAAALNPDSTKIDLTLYGQIQYGQTITVGFDDSEGTIYAADGGVLKTFTEYSVTNNVSEVLPGPGGGGTGVNSTGEVYTMGPPYHVFGEKVGVLVIDPDMNKTTSPDEVMVNVKVYGSSSEGITVTLTEDGADTGEFMGYFILEEIASGNSDSIKAVVGDVVQVTYIDAADSSGQVNQPRLTDIVVTDLTDYVELYNTEYSMVDSKVYLTGNLMWSPAFNDDLITHYAVYFLDDSDNIVGPQIVDPVPTAFVEVHEQVIAASIPAGVTQIGVFSMNANDHNYLSAVAAKVSLYGSFEPTVGDMVYGRYFNTATLLDDGRVLFVGGDDFTGVTSTAEVFDPYTWQFSRVDDMTTARKDHAAALLRGSAAGGYYPEGSVMITGGSDDYGIVDQAEIFDPTTNNFSSFGTMVYGRAKHTATTQGGSVLITGGMDSDGLPVAVAEQYGADGFIQVSSMVYARYDHTATLLDDGSVLITGGEDGLQNVSTAETYDLFTDTFTMAGEMNVPRYGHNSTLLQDGQVLVTGGFDVDGTPVTSAELWDPVTRTFSLVGEMALPRIDHTATLLPNGWVLITGGTNSTEIYIPSLRDFINGPTMSEGRIYESAVSLDAGAVLIAGGISTDSSDLVQQGIIYDCSVLLPLY